MRTRRIVAALVAAATATATTMACKGGGSGNRSGAENETRNGNGNGNGSGTGKGSGTGDGSSVGGGGGGGGSGSGSGGGGGGSGSATTNVAGADRDAGIENLPIDAAIAAKLPAERVLAYTLDHGAVIARLDHTGLHWVASMPAARQLAWTADGKTVVGLDGGMNVGSDIHLWTSTDAGAAVTSIVPADDGPMPDPTLPGAQLGTAGGAVWLRRCNDKEATVVKHGIVGCYDWMYRQLAPPTKDEVEKAPKGFALVTDEPKVATVAAPAGYKVEPIKFTVPTTQIPDGTLHHKGWKCTGPNGSAQYPDDSWGDFDTYTGKSVFWIMQDPPLYRATARSVSLAGEKADVSAVFVACESKPLDAYLDFGGGVWAAYGDIAPDAQAWTLRLGTTPIAHINGSELAAAPAPAP